MATTEILLLSPVDNLGNEGEQVKVRAGYARNYLLPRKLALPVNRANKKYVEALAKRREHRLAQEKDQAQRTAERLETLHIAIPVKTGEGGKMFGSVTANDLLSRLAEEGLVIEKKQINLYTPVKTLGKHTTTFKLHPEISFDLEWEVVSENPIEETDEPEPQAEQKKES